MGARYGSISCVTNSILNDKSKHIVVEPDSRVWEALNANCKNNNYNFKIIEGFISKTPMILTNKDDVFGYGSKSEKSNKSLIKSYTLDEVKAKYNINKFTALITDCDGFLEQFLNEN